MLVWLNNMTQTDKKSYLREYRKRTGNSVTKKYERTAKGKIMRTYRNMFTRVSGMVKRSSHRYKNKELIGKEEFYEWALIDETYNELYNNWVASGYQRKLSPSIDRIDAELGYISGNIRWLTQSENSRLGGLTLKPNRKSRKISTI